MGKKDKRIDNYLDKAAAFAKPILMHIREVVHKTCPEVEETMKWSFPHFDYQGEMMCSMAAFKQHCAFGFWKAAIMSEAAKLKSNNTEAMGHLGQIKSLSDLPPLKIFTALVKEAMKLNEQGVKLPTRKKTVSKDLEVPDYLSKALSKNKSAQRYFDEFPPSHRKEYILWITEAKSDETRNRRMEQAVEWIAEGKGRNWKYERKF